MSELVLNTSGAVGHSSGSLISGGVFTITSSPNDKVKAGGSGIHTTPLAYSFAGGSASGFQAGTISGTGTIQASASKVKASGVLVMRKGDSATMQASGTLNNGSPGSIAGGVEITNAGQNKVKVD